MEGIKDMTSNASNSTAAASAPHNHQQEAVVSSPTEAVVSSPTNKKEQASNTKKARAGGSGDPKPLPQQDAALSCPRCFSANTKFCYYNNYNMNQPRYFCKACRRYWTQGGSLRLVPVGGGSRRNKRASGSSSSSAASSTAATSAVTHNTVNTRMMLTAATTNTVSMSSPTTGLLFPNDMPPTLTPRGGSSGLDVAMDEDQQGFLPFTPLSLSDHQAPEELAPGGSDTGFLPFAPLSLSDDQALELELAPGGSETTPTLLDMLTGGYCDAGGSSSSYDAGLAMNGGSNGMDMWFLLPEMGASATDPMETQLVEEMDDVAGELQWQSYINDDGGYAAEPAAGVEQQQQVAGDPQEEDNKKARIV